VNRDRWLHAAHRTDEELWALAQGNRACAREVSSPVADAAVAPPATRVNTALEGPQIGSGSNGPRWTPQEFSSEHRAQMKAEGWVLADEAASPTKTKGKPTRYLPPDARFVSWVEARRGSASLSSIARRFNLTAAEVDVLLSRLTAAGAGIIMPHHGRGGGRRFMVLRTPRQPPAFAL
jgi:hypothetical protein